ncbi:hypothetical protein CN383_28665 [Priestia megaterium]|uniref:hypothetical protein n=1 Tax=Priestia megaterium TaxID=1404 RepID=UPI000BF90C2B|nr:hypothetical protein [Priestia megaterium]PFA93404.1 hypothetical protein CN383_28665 [Priestia megaterium]
MLSPEMIIAFWIGVLIPIVVLAILYLVFKISIKNISLSIIALGAFILFCSFSFGFTGAIYGAVAVGMIAIGTITLIAGLFDEIRILKKKISSDEEKTY